MRVISFYRWDVWASLPKRLLYKFGAGVAPVLSISLRWLVQDGRRDLAVILRKTVLPKID
jgi:hypothetical protein